MQRPSSSPSALRDPWFWGALAIGLVLRALPMLVWGWDSDACTRDECIYRIAARPILAGDGLGLAPKGWLPAPGYPYLMAFSQLAFGSMEAVKWVQWALTLPLLMVGHAVGARVGGRRGARWMAVGLALHPTLIFYTGTMWTETVYTLLLLTVVHATLWAREGGWGRGVAPGVALGLTILFRGVATYLGPLVALTLAAPAVLGAGRQAWTHAVRRRVRHAAAMLAAMALVVAPYSIAASSRWGGFVVTDATLGHVIAMGNDDYPPLTFDYMNGQLTGRLFAKTLSKGRRDCPRRGGPVEHDRCEVDRAVDWILDNPTTFVARIPERLAQLFNPHSFLTRHLRWNLWPGIPWALKELLVALQVACTLLLVVGGSWRLWTRGRGPWSLLITGTLVYNVAVVAALYGLTRFRLPLEPLWMLALAAPALDGPVSRWRQAGAIITTAILLTLHARFLWTGYPGF